MYTRTTTRDTDLELIEVLTAISVVSKRLAIQLAQMQTMKTEGGRVMPDCKRALLWIS